MDIEPDLDVPALLIAVDDVTGKSRFMDIYDTYLYSAPDVVQVSFFWETTGNTSLPHEVGQVPRSLDFPSPGDTRFGRLTFEPYSAGKLPYHIVSDKAPVLDDPELHRSDTIDYAVVISGKIDLVLSDGQCRTLTAGACIVLGGIYHAWKNHYSEPCVFAVVQVGILFKPD